MIAEVSHEEDDGSIARPLSNDRSDHQCSMAKQYSGKKSLGAHSGKSSKKQSQVVSPT